VPIQYFTILDRNLLDSCESLLFHGFSTLFKKVCQFQTYDKQYGRLMKKIWDINIVFLPVLFKIIIARENLSSRNSFVCNSLEINIFSLN
jgi:hypothetical protein